MGQLKEGELKREDSYKDDILQRLFKRGKVKAPTIRVFVSEEEKKNRELRKHWSSTYIDKGSY